MVRPDSEIYVNPGPQPLPLKEGLGKAPFSRGQSHCECEELEPGTSAGRSYLDCARFALRALLSEP